MVIMYSRPQQAFYNEKWVRFPLSLKGGGEAKRIAKTFGYGNIVW